MLCVYVVRRVATSMASRYIVETEGARALFKGLGPNLVGVAPSRAVYFATYSNSKSFLLGVLPPDLPVSLAHIISAASAGT